MFEGPLCPNLSQKVQKEVSEMANHNLSRVILLGGLSVNLNHLIINDKYVKCDYYLIQTGNLLLHQVIVINLSDECPMSDSS